MLSNSGITVSSFANKVVKDQPQSSFVLCTEYQGHYNNLSFEKLVLEREAEKIPLFFRFFLFQVINNLLCRIEIRTSIASIIQLLR